VAKLSVRVFRARDLQQLGHIFDFATLPVRLQGRFIRHGLPLRHRQQRRVVCVHPSCPLLSSSVSSTCVEGRCAFEHHRSSGLHRFTSGALAPTRLCSPGLHRSRLAGVYLLSDVHHHFEREQRKWVCSRWYYVGESIDVAQRFTAHRSGPNLGDDPRMVLLLEKVLSKKRKNTTGHSRTALHNR